ncbi:MAG: DUF5119 domain-containing protein [Tannerellaceae bacterium]|nr:DUF5119 domain-containing protein [Tannerellaceae bacterium]
MYDKINRGDTKRLRGLFLGGLLLLLSACEQITLSLGHTEGDIPVQVIIGWDGEPEDRLPQGMDVYWFPSGYGDVWSTEFNDRRGGYDYLYAEVFTPVCLDYDGNENLLVRGDGTREGLEVYNRPPDSRPVYCDSVTPLPSEVVVLEADAPYAFYVDAALRQVDIASAQWNDTLTVRFTPRNVLREYSFMIYGIEGAQNMIRSSGAISGMSASYWPATGELASRPSTILFTRTEAIRKGQNGRPGRPWTDSEKALFTAKDPNWDDPATGWTGDWVIGYFSTFGPIDLAQHRFRLTLEAYSTGNNYYYGAWGYWHGEWEDEQPLSVREQLTRATGGLNASPEQQLKQQEAWRKENGGFDIMLYNGNRLPPIPDDAPSSNGGFDLTIDDWGPIVDVPASSASPNAFIKSASLATTKTATSTKSGALKSTSYTADNLPGFVINGVWKKDDGSFEYFWNEQYVYRTEAGLYDYQPLKYWPASDGESNAHIWFQAYAPLSAGLSKGLRDANGALNEAPDDPLISYNLPVSEGSSTPPTGGGESTDIIVDCSNMTDLLVAVEEIGLPASSPELPVHFHHALARLQVQAWADGNDNTKSVRITKLELINLNISGDLILNKDMVEGNNKMIVPLPWKHLTNLARYPFVSSTDDYTLNANVATNIGGTVYIMPQEINKVQLLISWTVYNSAGTVDGNPSNNKTLYLPDGFAFEAGKSYQLSLKASGDFSSSWTTETPPP